MASQKDKDYHKLRNPQKYGLVTEDTYGNLTKAGAEAQKRYLSIWSKYGCKSMVGDKRRRNKTRKSNQKDRQLLHQVERARYKASLKAHLQNTDNPLHAKYGAGNIIVFSY